VSGGLPVERDWFRAEKVAPGVTLLVETYIDPLLESNVWHVRGRDADLVVDSGNGVGQLMPHISPLSQDRPVIAVATHGHFDHTGGLHEFEDRRCHPDDAPDVRQPFPLRLTREHFAEGTAEIFEFYGYPVPEIAVRAVPRQDFDLEGWSTPGAEPTRLLDEGDEVDLGDRRFRVMHVPGHTAGSIALWEASSGTLFTGDAAYVDDQLSWDDEAQFRSSLARLASLDPNVVCAGHGRTFDAEELQALAVSHR
jgi:glyoxylase-like metal-dependent hydrolase (beta-lactamase superfamily II)